MKTKFDKLTLTLLIGLLSICTNSYAQLPAMWSQFPVQATKDTGTYVMVSEDSNNVYHDKRIKASVISPVTSVVNYDGSLIFTGSGSTWIGSIDSAFSNTWTVEQGYKSNVASTYTTYSFVDLHDLDSTCNSVVSGNVGSVPYFTGTHQLGSTLNTDTPSLHKFTMNDTLILNSVPNAVDADSPLVWGLHSHKPRKVAPPSSVSSPLNVTWPGDVWSLSTIPVTYGGTGITSYTTAGAIPYSTGAYSMAALPMGANGTVLAVIGGLLTWEPLTSISVTSVTATSGSSLNFTVTGGSTPNITATLTPTGVTAGTYGSTTVIPGFTVGNDGRITGETNYTVAAATGIQSVTNTDGSAAVSVSGYTVNVSVPQAHSFAWSAAQSISTTGATVGVGTVPFVVSNTSTGGSINNAIFFAPNMTTGEYDAVSIGKNQNTNNTADMTFTYQSSGSTSNSLGLGLYSNDNLLNIFGSGDVAVGSTSDNGEKMTVAGTFSVTGQTNVTVLGGTNTASVTPFVVTSTEVNTVTGTTLNLVNLLTPNMVATQFNTLILGKNLQQNNGFYTGFLYQGNQSSSNAFSIGAITTGDFFHVFASGDVQVGATTTDLGKNLTVVGTASVSSTLGVGGALTALHLIGGGGAPTVAAGTGAGTSPTVTILSGSTDMSGWISITTGSSPTASATVATITYNTAYGAVPKVSLSPVNANAAALTGAAAIWPDYTSTTTTACPLLVGTSGLATTTTYIYKYTINQ